jgi:hypothetical protein
MALGDPAHAAHCLTEDHHGIAQGHDHAGAAGQAHVHHDGTSHKHPAADHSDGKAASECCGVFCLTALPALLADLVSGPVFTSLLFAMAPPDRAGRGPDLLYRPPITLLRT